MNLLLVEDDVHIQQLFRAAIEELEEPLHVYTSESSNKALQIAAENVIDLFVIDIQLTDYKGTQLAKQLREIEVYSYTPMIFATALAGEELMAYRELKCYHFLIKPFTKQEIKQVLIEAIAYRKHLSEPPKTIRIEQRGFILELSLKKMMYLESFGKKIEIHIVAPDGTERIEVISGFSLKRLKEMIGDDDFIQCHKSFIVNKHYIYKIDKVKNNLLLTEFNREIPIGKKFLEHLQT
ncbi:LytTR family DNA-binding domain-containing protein [Siminovitchia sp. FSL W7-1587]|uniref:LytR/AlgR family response regulator transcription factor n=1 Tax=Siminovitchia sp. FSL W7-1587 TaxID=2954699 RepID=UPI0030D394AF